LFIRMGWRPRARKSKVKLVSMGSPHDPSLAWRATASAARWRYQSCLPKYFSPDASPTRSIP
jgi:hypothetical protein